MLAAAFGFEGLSQPAQSVRPAEPMNSEREEVAPIFSARGDVLYFTRAFSAQNKGGVRDEGDIWTARRLGKSQFSVPEPVRGALNNAGRNKVLGFNAAGDVMYLLNAYEEGFSRKPFAYSKKSAGGSWSAPKPLDLGSFRPAGNYGASLSKDGSVMVLYGESYGSRGAEDLYISFRETDLKWTDPVHLGDRLNTPFQEVSPFLAPDNKTLYFSSNGHPGAGSFDVFVSHRLDGSWKNWSEPSNLGATVNTKGSEKFYQVGPEGILAYYTSTKDSEGYSDIKFIWSADETYRAPALAEKASENAAEEAPAAEKAGEKAAEKALAAEKNAEKAGAGAPAPEASARKIAKLRVVDAKSGEAISFAYKIGEGEWKAARGGLEADVTGGSLPCEIKAAGYMPASFDLLPQAAGQCARLEPLAVGSPIVLRGVLFERGTVRLAAGSEAQLRKLVGVLQENPGMRIEIGGHTDNRGGARAKNRLSLNRAVVVKDYLRRFGIGDARVETRGYGSSRPIASNQNEESRRLNRRVEFKVLEK